MRGYVWNRNFGIQLVERSESLNIHIFNPTIVTKLIGNSILTNVCKETNYYYSTFNTFFYFEQVIRCLKNIQNSQCRLQKRQKSSVYFCHITAHTVRYYHSKRNHQVNVGRFISMYEKLICDTYYLV